MLGGVKTTTRCWEYRAILLSRQESVETDLDRLGDEGWELVSVVADYAYLKRPTYLRFISTDALKHRRRDAGLASAVWWVYTAH